MLHDNLVTQKVQQVVDLVEQAPNHARVRVEVDSRLQVGSKLVERVDTGNRSRFEQKIRTDWNLYQQIVYNLIMFAINRDGLFRLDSIKINQVYTSVKGGTGTLETHICDSQKMVSTEELLQIKKVLSSSDEWEQLVQVRELAKHLKGFISVKSDEDSGTKISLFIQADFLVEMSEDLTSFHVLSANSSKKFPHCLEDTLNSSSLEILIQTLENVKSDEGSSNQLDVYAQHMK